MNLYHLWIYEHILNTRWFVSSIVYFLFVINMLGPILIWLIMSGKKIPFIQKKKKAS